MLLPRPGETELHLWSTRLDGELTPGDQAWLLNQLTHVELQRLMRFQHPAARDAFLRSHCLLQSVLTLYDGIPPTSRIFFTSSHGKPSIAPRCNPLGLNFNLSHSGRYALLLVGTATELIGVDIEQHKPDRPLRQLSERYFSARERAFIADLDHQQRTLTSAFFSLWSLKEAFVKAHGRGIALGLDRFSFDLAESTAVPGFSTDLALDPPPECWLFRRLEWFPHHSAALASARPIETISLHEMHFIAAAEKGATFLTHTTDYQH